MHSVQITDTTTHLLASALVVTTLLTTASNNARSNPPPVASSKADFSGGRGAEMRLFAVARSSVGFCTRNEEYSTRRNRAGEKNVRASVKTVTSSVIIGEHGARSHSHKVEARNVQHRVCDLRKNFYDAAHLCALASSQLSAPGAKITTLSRTPRRST